jgi:hypothetical protein
VAIPWSPSTIRTPVLLFQISRNLPASAIAAGVWESPVADYDNDGLLDLYVTGYNGNVLYHNLGGCKFEDVTTKSGLSVGGFSTGAAWADYDRDGHVDLFVSRYIHTDVDKLGAITTNYKGLAVEAPWGMHGESDFLFHNRGDGTFEDVSKKAVSMIQKGDWAWAPYGATTTTTDGLIYMLRMTPSQTILYRNKHDGTFEDIALLSGAAVSGEGKALGSMGVDFGDFDRDGRLDITVTTFAYQPVELHRNVSADEFSDVTWTAKTGQPTFPICEMGNGIRRLRQ